MASVAHYYTRQPGGPAGALYAEAQLADARQVAKARAMALEPGKQITLHAQRTGEIVLTFVRTLRGVIVVQVDLTNF